MPLDYDKAGKLLADLFLQAEQAFQTSEAPKVPKPIAGSVDALFASAIRAGIQDYLFVYSNATPSDDARAAARIYFSQGHEINFVQIKAWILNNLATLGSKCRGTFTKEVLTLLDGRDIPATLKLVWNDSVRKLVSE